MDLSKVLLSFGLTFIVGASTALGSLFSFFVKETNKKILAIAFGFAAGIMIYASFMSILPEGIELIDEYTGKDIGHIMGMIGFFGGILIIALIEKLVHSLGGDHHVHDDLHQGHSTNIGLASAIGIAIHNLPEGLALFTAGLKDIKVALPIGIAILIHNIPLGIAISVPMYYSTKSRAKTFIYTLLVGLCQPLGAIIGYLIFSNSLNDILFGILFSIIAGIMIFVSIDELLPTAQEYDNHHTPVYGAIAGMFIMALSLLLFGHHH